MRNDRDNSDKLNISRRAIVLESVSSRNNISVPKMKSFSGHFLRSQQTACVHDNFFTDNLISPGVQSPIIWSCCENIFSLLDRAISYPFPKK